MKKAIIPSLVFAALAPVTALADVSHPLELIKRPRTQPGGEISLSLMTGLTNPGSGIPLGLQAVYGISPALEVDVGYTLALKDFEAKGNLRVGVAYNLMASGPLSLAADVYTGYSVLGEAINPLAVGLRAQYDITPQLAVGTQGGHLKVALDGDPKPIDFQMPLRVYYQAMPQLAVGVDTNLFNIGISNSGNAFFGADFIPLDLWAHYALNGTMDVGAGIQWFDLKNFSDVLLAHVMFRYHM